ALVQKHLLEKLARRYATESSEAGFAACATLLERAGRSTAAMNSVLGGLDKGFAGRVLDKMPAPLAPWFTAHPPGQDVTLIRVGLKLGAQTAQTAAWQLINDSQASEHDRAAMIELMGETRSNQVAGLL